MLHKRLQVHGASLFSPIMQTLLRSPSSYAWLDLNVDPGCLGVSSLLSNTAGINLSGSLNVFRKQSLLRPRIGL